MRPHCLSWDPFLAVVFSVVFTFFLQYSLKQNFSTDSVLIPIGWHAAANESGSIVFHLYGEHIRHMMCMLETHQKWERVIFCHPLDIARKC